MSESDLIIESIINRIESGNSFQYLSEMARPAKYQALTGWVTPAEAKQWIRDAYDAGDYKPGELKLSSKIWADKTDHSKGYRCRVIVVGSNLLADREAAPKREKRSTRSTDPEASFERIAKRSRKHNEELDDTKTSINERIDSAINGVLTAMIRAIHTGQEIEGLEGVDLVWRSPVPERDALTWACWVVMKKVQKDFPKITNQEVLDLAKSSPFYKDLQGAATDYANAFGMDDDWY